MKEKILNYVTDLVSDFLYYDRKEDEEMPRGFIEEQINNGNISIEEIVNHFEKTLKENI